MKISNSAKYVIGVSAAVALLAGCTGNGGSSDSFLRHGARQPIRRWARTTKLAPR